MEVGLPTSVLGSFCNVGGNDEDEKDGFEEEEEKGEREGKEDGERASKEIEENKG